MRKFLYIYFLICSITFFIFIWDSFFANGNFLKKVFFVGYGEGSSDHIFVGIVLQILGFIIVLSPIVFVIIIIIKRCLKKNREP